MQEGFFFSQIVILRGLTATARRLGGKQGKWGANIWIFGYLGAPGYSPPGLQPRNLIPRHTVKRDEQYGQLELLCAAEALRDKRRSELRVQGGKGGRGHTLTVAERADAGFEAYMSGVRHSRRYAGETARFAYLAGRKGAVRFLVREGRAGRQVMI